MRALEFPKLLETIGRKTGDRPAEVWRRHLAMSFAALSYGTREQVYMDAIKSIKDRPEVLEHHAQAFAVMVNDYEHGERFADHLGDYHMDLQSKKAAQFGGEFFTPTDLARLMASLSRGQLPTDKPIDVHEPACGSGRMVLAVAEDLVAQGHSPLCMRVNAWDLNVMCAQMTYINLTLWGIPAVVVHGNTMSLEVFWQQRTPFYGLAKAPRSTNYDAIVERLKGVLEHVPEQPVLGSKAEQVSLF